MRIVVTDAGVADGSLFKLVWTGWVVGTGVVFVPLVFIALIAVLIGRLFEAEVGDVVGALLAFIMVPAILAGQGLVIGMILVFGIWVYRKFRPIRLERPSGAAVWPPHSDG